MLQETKIAKAIRMTLSGLMVTTALAIPSIAQAQENEESEEAVDNTEKVVVTGSRGAPRSVSDSAVPIDIFSEQDIKDVSFTDTNDILRNLVPSFNLNRQPISDGASFIRPAQMRGLPSDKVLVLVNSKRRHRASLVQIGGAGTQGPDLATIPASALKTVEVLRDGAAAQYGSDAIAGVINLHLKDNDEGGSFNVLVGQHGAGDGEQITVNGNIGFALGDNGFFSLSGEISDQDFTQRAEQVCENFYCVDENDPRFLTGTGFDPTVVGFSEEAFIAGLETASLQGDVVIPWGQPNAEAVRVFYNAGYDISDSMNLYSFGSYSDSESDSSFFYRFPGNGTIENLRLEDGSVYSPLEIFPGGFTPRFFGDIQDVSFVAGLKGEFTEDFTYDFSVRYGSNEIDYTLINTINPSLGPDSPTAFNPGALENEEFQLQADFVNFVEVGLPNALIVAYGLSYLDESYDITEGEESSFIAGDFAVADPFGFCNDDGTETAVGLSVIANGSNLDCSNPDDPAFRVVGVGSNGFPGFSPGFSEDFSRDSFAAYIDLSSDITDAVFLQAALRYENYDDFDSELVWKLATQIDISETFGLRASVGTGFRAPTPGQQGTTNVSTRLPNGFPVAVGLFPASSPVAQALGAQDLLPETSVNYTIGFTADVYGVNVTLDFYRIELDDRFNAISTLDVSTDSSSGAAFDNFLALQNAGVVGAESIGGVFYFQNAFDTTTQGFDLVATKSFDWSAGSTTISASFNYNDQEFDSDPSVVLNEEETFDFINNDPNVRGIINGRHTYEDWTFLARANYFGSYENFNAGQTQDFDPEVFVDLEVSYQVTDTWRVSLGARNIFDNFPDAGVIGDASFGRIFRSDSVVPWQGSFYHLVIDGNF